jgi:hypothetical protein
MAGYSVIESKQTIPTTYMVMYTAEGMRGFYLLGGYESPEAAWAAIPDRTKPPGEEPNISFFRDDFAGRTPAYLRKESGLPSTEIVLRPEVRAFAEAMELKLRKHDDWPGWKDCDPMVLMQDLIVHLGKFASSPDETLLGSAADLGNFAMMICDACGLLLPAPAPGEKKLTRREQAQKMVRGRYRDH